MNIFFHSSKSILAVLGRNHRIGDDLVADVIDQSADNLIDGVTSAQENTYTFNHYYGKNRRQDDEGHRDFAQEGGFLCPSGTCISRPQKHRSMAWCTVYQKKTSLRL